MQRDNLARRRKISIVIFSVCIGCILISYQINTKYFVTQEPVISRKSPALTSLNYIGVIESKHNTWALLSKTNAKVFHVKIGDLLDNNYRINQISESVIEMQMLHSPFSLVHLQLHR